MATSGDVPKGVDSRRFWPDGQNRKLELIESDGPQPVRGAAADGCDCQLLKIQPRTYCCAHWVRPPTAELEQPPTAAITVNSVICRPESMSRAIGPAADGRTGAVPENGDYCQFCTKRPRTYCCAPWLAAPAASWSRSRDRRLLSFLYIAARFNEHSNRYLRLSPESRWRLLEQPIAIS